MLFLMHFENQLSRFYRFAFCAGFLAISALGISSNAHATPPQYHHLDSHDEDELKLGLKLENRFWTSVKHHHKEGYSEKLSHIFQGLNNSGAYTRDQQIVGLENANLESFSLESPLVRQADNVLVITYVLSTTGTGITDGPNISTWKKEDDRWKMVSHAYVSAPN